jgi:hypothetical protein
MGVALCWDGVYSIAAPAAHPSKLNSKHSWDLCIDEYCVAALAWPQSQDVGCALTVQKRRSIIATNAEAAPV